MIFINLTINSLTLTCHTAMIQQNAKEVISVKEENIIHEFPALPENEQFTTYCVQKRLQNFNCFSMNCKNRNTT